LRAVGPMENPARARRSLRRLFVLIQQAGRHIVSCPGESLPAIRCDGLCSSIGGESDHRGATTARFSQCAAGMKVLALVESRLAEHQPAVARLGVAVEAHRVGGRACLGRRRRAASSRPFRNRPRGAANAGIVQGTTAQRDKGWTEGVEEVTGGITPPPLLPFDMPVRGLPPMGARSVSLSPSWHVADDDRVQTR